MEMNLKKQSVTINETALDGFYEQGIECDIILPDYCPDVVKILKCAVTPAILSTQTAGDKISVEGMAVVNLYYQSNDTAILCYEHKYQFTKTCDLKASVYQPVVEVSAVVDYINCRAVSQRRIDVRGAMTLNAKVTGQRQEEIISGADGMGICLKRTVRTATMLAASADKQFTVREDLELGSGKPAVGHLIRTKCCAVPGDCKAIPNKAILKGELRVHMLYQPQNPEDEPETMDYFLPVSQIVDVEGIDEDALCDIRFRVVSADLTPKGDSDGETRELSLSATVAVTVKAYRNMDIALAEDCYSTQFECESGVRQLDLMKAEELLDEAWQYKQSIQLPPDTIAKIADVWCDMGKCTAQVQDGTLQLEGNATACVLGYDGEGRPAYCEQPLTIQYRRELRGGADGSSAVSNYGMDIISASFTSQGDSGLEIRCDMQVHAYLSCDCTARAISTLSVDENRPKERDNKAALTIYFADEGEDIWDIAKKYNTSVDAVLGENELAGDVLSNKQMLMIPII